MRVAHRDVKQARSDEREMRRPFLGWGYDIYRESPENVSVTEHAVEHIKLRSPAKDFGMSSKARLYNADFFMACQWWWNTVRDRERAEGRKSHDGEGTAKEEIT
jgi:hypothetical protein